MVEPAVSMLASEIPRMPLHYVCRDFGVTQEHGADPVVRVANAHMDRSAFRCSSGRQ